jgi:hypothetical protein
MKYKQIFFFVSIVFSLCFLFTMYTAQAQSKDVVYLKNGSVIKGEIIEQVPNSLIKIQTADGSIFNCSYSDIEKITKESIEPKMKNTSVSSPTNKGSVWIFGDLKFTSKGGEINESGGKRYVTIDLAPTIAYFIVPGLALGMNVQINIASQGDNSNTMWGLAPALIYVIGGDEPKNHIKGSTYPYLVAAGLFGSETFKRGTYSTSSSISGFSFGGGICQMLTESFGFNMRITYNYYSISPESGSSGTGNDIDMEIGLIGIL